MYADISNRTNIIAEIVCHSNSGLISVAPEGEAAAPKRMGLPLSNDGVEENGHSE